MASHVRLIMGIVALTLTAPAAVQAQYLDPRASQAIALCNSPAGAAIADCAKLRAMMGAGMVPGVAGNPAAVSAAAGLLGALTGAAQNAQAAQAAAAAAAAAQGAGYYNNSAMATYNAGQAYQACVAANPANWQMCVQQMQNSPQNQAAAAIAASQQAALAQMQTPQGQQRYAACVRQYGAPNANNAAQIQGCFFGPAQGAAIAQTMLNAGAPQLGYPMAPAPTPAPGYPLPAAPNRPAASADPLAALLGK